MFVFIKLWQKWIVGEFLQYKPCIEMLAEKVSKCRFAGANISFNSDEIIFHSFDSDDLISLSKITTPCWIKLNYRLVIFFDVDIFIKTGVVLLSEDLCKRTIILRYFFLKQDESFLVLTHSMALIQNAGWLSPGEE